MKSDILFNTIEIGDIVRLNQPYKTDDFQNNDTFLAALNNGVIPPTYVRKLRLYQSWAGFNYGIVNDILSRKADGKPRTFSLFLYYQQPNGVWLMYSLKHGIPTFVDFHTSEVTLIHKSSAPDYGSGNVS